MEEICPLKIFPNITLTFHHFGKLHCSAHWQQSSSVQMPRQLITYKLRTVLHGAIIEYLLLLDHPASKMPMIPSDETAVTANTPMLKSTACNPCPNGMAPKARNEATITKGRCRTEFIHIWCEWFSLIKILTMSKLCISRIYPTGLDQVLPGKKAVDFYVRCDGASAIMAWVAMIATSTITNSIR